MRRRVLGSIVVALSAFAVSGVRVIRQDEVGVVRRFGAVRPELWGPGLHWGLPWGMDRVDRLQPGKTRSLTIGDDGQTAAPLSRRPDPEADDVLTGDLNLVTAQVTLQYRVSDPTRFLFASTSIEDALSRATEAALTRAVASRRVDDVLTTGRAEVADAMAALIQSTADRQGLGVSIRAVRLGRVAPPVPVADAFADAARARSDRRQAVSEAEAYRDRTLADARGRSREIADAASAAHDRAVQLARGEADRFSSVLTEAARSPDASRRRLYLEAIAELLPRVDRTVVVDPGEAVDLGLFAGGRGPAESNAKP
ncbi:FtsH protease activity modulator HflK [Tautonia sociabilis]|uniref:Protein HflK n=1 Tax=Tautonia sociabilis TaxID=2080755 RepID=A0A432MHB2_9BACT|nr:FtsH protease activity modulator HflK [Tautonia sociabilis]RUL86191.1 FtsH protease activity modulator HflK [Tautonia sociabilis]